MLRIRPETPADHAAVRAVNERAFERAAEADLVEALRRAAHPHRSLVAEDEHQIVGHIFFSPVEIDPVESEPVRHGLAVLGLAPMAVHPDRQRQGIGGALVREGLRACADLGGGAVVVLGHPAYYPRFGFRPAATFGLRCTYDVPDEVFMALELLPGALDGVSGTVHYHPAFSEVE